LKEWQGSRGDRSIVDSLNYRSDRTDPEDEDDWGAIATGGESRFDAVARDTQSAITLGRDPSTEIDKSIFERQRAHHPRNCSVIVIVLALELEFDSRTAERCLADVHHGSRTITTTRARAIAGRLVTLSKGLLTFWICVHLDSRLDRQMSGFEDEDD
jgi:hypothetical protein